MTRIRHTRTLWVIAAFCGAVLARPAAAGPDDWTFGIGTGFSSFSLNGDVGLPTNTGGIIVDLDLSNSETQDFVQSGFGVNGFASRDRLTILYSVGRVTLKDSDGPIKAEWDKTQAEVSAVYDMREIGSNRFAGQVGIRYTDHDWDFSGLPGLQSPHEDWTDVFVGVVHTLPFAKAFQWKNIVNYGLGGSDGTFLAQTALVWKPLDHWNFNVNARYLATDYGDKDDQNKSDFYYYDVDEIGFGLGFMYIW